MIFFTRINIFHDILKTLFYRLFFFFLFFCFLLSLLLYSLLFLYFFCLLYLLFSCFHPFITPLSKNIIKSMSAQKSYEGKRFNVLYGIKLSSIEKCINIWVYLYWYIFFPINILWKGFPDNISYPSHQQSLPDVMLKITYELKRNEIKFPFKTKFFFLHLILDGEISFCFILHYYFFYPP